MTRTPLHRYTELKRTAIARGTSHLKTYKPMRRRSPKRAAEQRRWNAITRANAEAFGYRCPVRSPDCRGEITQGHHAKPKGRGGKSTPENNRPMCGGCHDYCHAHEPWARSRGLFLNSWEAMSPPIVRPEGVTETHSTEGKTCLS